MIPELTEKIRASARRLLENKEVDCVIGFEQGTVPMRDRPSFAYTPEDADKLIWSSFCVNNLALFLIRREMGEIGKVAITAQGCVSRNIAILIQENQIKREQVHIIGVPSPEKVDRRKVIKAVKGKTIHSATEEGEEIVVKGVGWEERIDRKKVLRDNCYTCMHRNPVIYDELAAEFEPETGGGDLDKVAAPWDRLEPEKRYEKFAKEILKDCIRCYACRDACPLCYCHVCFVDEARPQWCGKTQDDSDVATFHILRAFHCAGRCTDCGACQSACPQGINMRRLTSKIEKDIREMYGWEPGLDPEAQPPLSVYQPDDPEDFVR
jgi:formate dehydrogenase subunit beta